MWNAASNTLFAGGEIKVSRISTGVTYVTITIIGPGQINQLLFDHLRSSDL